MTRGFGYVFKKLATRAIWLYFWTILLTLLFTNWGNLMPYGSVKTGLWELRPDNWPSFFIKTLTFQYSYGWADILPYYTVFLVFAPFYLWILSRGGVLFLLLINFGIWILRGGNIYSSIQSLYFLGVTLGYYQIEIGAYWARWSKQAQDRIKNWTYAGFAVTLVLSIVSVFFFDQLAAFWGWNEWFVAKNRVLNWYFDKQTVGLGRMILAPFWLLTGIFLVDRWKKEIEEMFGWILFTFGKNSLEAYIVHAIVIFPIPYLVNYFGLTGWWWNTVVTVGAIVGIYVLTILTVKLKKYLLEIK